MRDWLLAWEVSTFIRRECGTRVPVKTTNCWWRSRVTGKWRKWCYKHLKEDRFMCTSREGSTFLWGEQWSRATNGTAPCISCLSFSSFCFFSGFRGISRENRFSGEFLVISFGFLFSTPKTLYDLYGTSGDLFFFPIYFLCVNLNNLGWVLLWLDEPWRNKRKKKLWNG